MKVVVAMAVAMVASCVAACGGAPSSNAKTPSASAIAWIEDDYTAAIARGRSEKKPVVVVVWTAWCSPCRTMREATLRDSTITSHARELVWLSIDAERDANAAFVAKHAVDALPAVSVIDPTTESARATWRGPASPPELAAMLMGGPGETRAEPARDDADDARIAEIEAARARAPNAGARAAFDQALLDAWRARHEPDRAIAALEESARALPRDYDVLSRLAHAYRLAGRFDDAQRAIDRSAALSYGPRKIVVLAEKSSVESARGDMEAAKRTLDEALELARSLNLTGDYARRRAELEVRRAEWKTRQKP